MKVTGNMVKARIADHYRIDNSNVVMNALYWNVLLEDHAALLRYGIDGDIFKLPFVAIAIDDELYLCENESIEVNNIESSDNWLCLSNGKTTTGNEIINIINKLKL